MIGCRRRAGGFEMALERGIRVQAARTKVHWTYDEVRIMHLGLTQPTGQGQSFITQT